MLAGGTRSREWDRIATLRRARPTRAAALPAAWPVLVAEDGHGATPCDRGAERERSTRGKREPTDPDRSCSSPQRLLLIRQWPSPSNSSNR
jgi:hypothetical protein